MGRGRYVVRCVLVGKVRRWLRGFLVFYTNLEVNLKLSIGSHIKVLTTSFEEDFGEKKKLTMTPKNVLKYKLKAHRGWEVWIK